MLIEILKKHNMKTWQLANILGVAISQIHRWDKNGISKYSPYAETLKQMFPELELTASKHAKAGRTKKQLTLSESDIPTPPEERKRKSDFPTVVFRKKTK